MKDYNEFKFEYMEQLALEAVTVGSAFVPWTFIVSGMIKRLPFPESVKSPLSIFVAGAGFHLVAEFSGLNEYYLKNSASHMLSMRKWMASCKSGHKSRKKACGIHFLE